MIRPAFRILSSFIFTLLFLGQGITAPFHNDEETRPAGIVLDIVNHGNWLVPVDLHGEVTRKPPLFYWIAAGIADIRGGVVDEAGTRLVSLIAAAATAAVVIELARAHFGIVSGWLAYLFLLGTYGFASRAGLARTDMLFTFLLFAAYSAFYPLTRGEGSASRAFVVGALGGLAMLTKGPLAIVLCVVGIGLYFAAIGRNPWKGLMKSQSAVILVLAFVVVAGWYIPAFIRNPRLLQIQLVEENLGHFLPTGLGGTGEAARPMYYLWLRFLGATLPLNFYLLAVLPRLRPERKAGGMLLYQLAFLVGTVGFFTISSAKRDDYILAALPSYAMVIAAPFAEDADSSSARLANVASFVAAFAFLTLAVGGFIASRQRGMLFGISANLHPSDAAYARLLLMWSEHHVVRTDLTMLVVAGASAMALFFVWKRLAPAGACCIALAEIAALSLWIGVLMPEFAQERTLKAFVLDARKIVGSQGVMIAGGRNYEVSYYFGRGVPSAPKDFGTGNWPCNATYLFVWSQQFDQLRTNRNLFRGSVVLISPAASSRHRMLLLSLKMPSKCRGKLSLGFEDAGRVLGKE